jgi:hypothetical protein
MAFITSRLKISTAIAILLVIGAIALYTWFTLSWSYAKGERAGWVQKFSQKGWLCKTWEGELVMVSMPGTQAEKFAFSVRGDSLANRINQAAGKRVVLIYEHHKGVPSSCFGETDYFATDIRIID